MTRVLAVFCTGVALVIGGWVAEGARIESQSAAVDALPIAPRVRGETPPTYDADAGLWVVPDADGPGRDVLGYAGEWYARRAGYWYRSRSFFGPYRAIAFTEVPPRVLRRLKARA